MHNHVSDDLPQGASDANARQLAQQDRVGGRTLLHRMERDFSGPALDALLDLRTGVVPRERLCESLLRPASEFLRRPGKRFRGRLVEICWALSVPKAPAPRELSFIVELIHAGSLIVDDIEDGSTHRRSLPTLHSLYGLPLALNTGNWFYFWPFELLAGLHLPAAVELDLHRRLTRTMLRCHVGQALDLGTQLGELAQDEAGGLVAAMAELKTGSLMELAATVGPVAAGAASRRVAAFAHFGLRLGVGLQMLDDLGNLSGGRDPEKRHEDLRLGRATWVWAWLSRHADHRSFAALQHQADEVRRGDRDPEELAVALRDRLGCVGRTESRNALARALAELQRELGAADLTPLEEELARVEASYE